MAITVSLEVPIDSIYYNSNVRMKYANNLYNTSLMILS